jgi:hypothetical protein
MKKTKVVIELVIDWNNYDLGESLEDIVYDELSDLIRSDILSACVIEEVA